MWDLLDHFPSEKKRFRDVSGHKLVFLTNLFSFERFFESFFVKMKTKFESAT